MTWTNLFGLPEPMAAVIKNDLYSDKRDEATKAWLKENPEAVGSTHFSATTLTKPVRQVTIDRYNSQNYVNDVSSAVFRLTGQLFHHLFRDAAVRENIKKSLKLEPEHRLFAHLPGLKAVVSGEPDLVSEDGVVDDYKVTSVWAWKDGAKLEWEQQLNVYAWLRRMNGLQTTKLRVVYILRDWSQREAKIKKDYPQAQVLTAEVPMWSAEMQERFVREQVSELMHASNQYESHGNDSYVVECGPDQMWEKPSTYAVIKKGAGRATKVFKTVDDEGTEYSPEQVQAMAEAYAKSKGPEFEVEHRPGERTRCEFYCSANQFCSQYKEYKAAKYHTVGGGK